MDDRTTDEQLLADGGEQAMTELVTRHARPLYQYLRRMTGDAHLAEDVFGETFLRLVRSRAGYRADRPLKPYLYRIAVNAARDALRRRARDRAEPLATPLPARAPTSAATGLSGPLADAVERLPATEREVVLLRVVCELGFREIAELTGVPIPTAKSRMRYAVRRLRPELETYDVDA